MRFGSFLYKQFTIDKHLIKLNKILQYEYK